jgi:hypothetical protein
MSPQKPLLSFDPGNSLFTWEAYDYHPHQRGWVWLLVFCAITFGGALWALWSGDWIMALTFFVVAAVYFYTHRQGNEVHQVHLTEKGILIDGRDFFYWEKLAGYWFIYDETVSVINFQFDDQKRDRKISLQMGEVEPDTFREIFEKADFTELTNKKESLMDLWIRALKL